MPQPNGMKLMLAGVCTTWLLTVGSLGGTAHAHRAKPALAADHVIACVRTAA